MKKTIKTAGNICLAATVLAAAMYLFSARMVKSDTNAPEANKRLPVVLSPIREMTFEERIKVSGNVEAKNTAIISARISGVLDTIFVDRGDSVKPGQKLFQTDKIKLEQAKESAEQQVAVMVATVQARAATVDRIAADLEKARIDFERYERLYRQDRAVAQNVFEAQESRFKQVKAALKEAKAGVALSRAQEAQARSNLAIARKNLADSLVTAPIAGKVSQRMMEPGEMARSATAVLRIDDLSVVEICAYLPEKYYTRVVEGQTILRAGSGGMDIGAMAITTKSPTINPKLRTFEIRALLKNPPRGVVPGTRAEVAVILQKSTGFGVPAASVLRRGKGQVVFTVKQGIAHMLTIETGLESDGWVEVRGVGLAAGQPIVRMGQERLNEDMAVVEVKEGAE